MPKNEKIEIKKDIINKEINKERKDSNMNIQRILGKNKLLKKSQIKEKN